MKNYRRRIKFLAAWMLILLQIFALAGCRGITESGDKTGSAGETETLKGSGSAGETETGKGSGSAELTGDQSGDILQVQVLKIGKADAILLFCGGRTMVIDCGEEEDGQEVLEYLQGKGVSEIDVLMITHFDKDHVGGADTVVEEMPVKRVLLPAYTGSGTEYTDFMAALENAGLEPENLQESVRFHLGDASVLVEPPASYEIPEGDEEYDNNFSLITTVEYSGQRMIFTGDIEKQRIRQWLAEGEQEQKTCAVLKVPHHGVYNTALEDLFRTLQPSYAILCDSKKNPADDRTLELLHQYGADCLQTKNGDVSVICSKKGIEIRQK